MTKRRGKQLAKPPPQPSGPGIHERITQRVRQTRGRSGGGEHDLLQNFAASARSALTVAQEEAAGFGHNYLGTEHILLGILRNSDSVASKALSSLGVSREHVRNAVEHIIGRGQQPPSGRLGLTPRSKHVLELAVAEAHRRGRSFAGTQHLLFGLLIEGNGIAAGILVSLGVDLDRAVAAVDAILDAEGLAEEDEPAASRAKNTVVMCRVDDHDLAAIDALIEAGIRTTRSDAASWLIHAGIEANGDLFGAINATVAEIRRLRAAAQSLAEQAMAGDATTPAPDAGQPQPPAATD